MTWLFEGGNHHRLINFLINGLNFVLGHAAYQNWSLQAHFWTVRLLLRHTILFGVD
jgi:hypothetical protein